MDEIHILTRSLTTDQVQDIAKGIVPAFTKARAPNPANGATGVQMPLFRWTAGDGAKFHNIYMGASAELTEAHLAGPRSVLAMYYHPTPLEPGKTYYWRVDEIEGDGVTVHQGDVWSFTVQALTAYGPSPADGTIDASLSPTLTWLPGQAVVKHQVYFGTSQDAVAKGDQRTYRGQVTDKAFLPGDLQEAGQYYWRIDELTADGKVRTGPVWTFRTFVQVDDFEKYTDDEGSRIYETWIDGWTNTTGSRVGYVQAPFCEQTIVHGGKQSMPFDYNNTKAPYYSEVEQEFPAAQGGGTYDIDTLVLWVRGQPTNSPATLYVALKDTRGKVGVVSYPDPAILTLSKWTEWRIFMPDFTATGVDIMSVKTLMIGVGNRQAPAAGGAGLIWLDDIHAIKAMTVDPSQMPVQP